MVVSGQLHAPATLSLEINPRGTHSIGSWRGPESQEKKKSLAPTGN